VQKKIVTAVVVAALAAVGWFGYVNVRFFLFTMRVREVVNELGRFPDVDKMIHLKDGLREASAKYKIPEATYGSKIRIEGRGAEPVRFYYVVAKVIDGTRSFEYDEHRIESQKQLFEQEEKLTEAGIEIRK
jgi:hypothetical protein